MKKYFLTASLLVLVLNTALAGDKGSPYLTGNRSVDFFGAPGSYASAQVPGARIFPETAYPASGQSEKSPWIAGLLSAAVPGAGEFYSGSYIKAGIFFGIEVASWAISIHYNRKGDRQTEFYKAYADAHYSPIRYAQWLEKYVDQINPAINPSDYQLWTQYDSGGAPFSHLSWPELNRMEYAVGDGFTHRLPVYGEQQYYELIGKYKQFSKGWDDEPDEFDHTTPEAKYYYYAEQFNLADKYYINAGRWVTVIVANHVLSALDAAWSASRHNRALHADLNIRMEPSPIGFVPVAQATLQYTF